MHVNGSDCTINHCDNLSWRPCRSVSDWPVAVITTSWISRLPPVTSVKWRSHKPVLVSFIHSPPSPPLPLVLTICFNNRVYNFYLFCCQSLYSPLHFHCMQLCTFSITILLLSTAIPSCLNDVTILLSLTWSYYQ